MDIQAFLKYPKPLAWILSIWLLLPTNGIAQSSPVEINFRTFFETVPEDTGEVIVDLLASGLDSNDITVRIILEVSSNVTNGEDIIFNNPLDVVIPALSDTITSFSVTILEDELIEIDEQIMLAIESVTGNAFTGPDGEHVIQIIDNDSCKYPSIYGLDSSYCMEADPVQLQGKPYGGYFKGSGIVDSTFYPSLAGSGTHEIQYIINDGTCHDSTSHVVQIAVCTAIEPIHTETALRILPNPNTGRFVLYGAPALGDVVSLEIFDAMGKSVYRENQRPLGNLDLDLSPGIYLLKIAGNDWQSIQKLVIR